MRASNDKFLGQVSVPHTRGFWVYLPVGLGRGLCPAPLFAGVDAPSAEAIPPAPADCGAHGRVARLARQVAAAACRALFPFLCVRPLTGRAAGAAPCPHPCAAPVFHSEVR